MIDLEMKTCWDDTVIIALWKYKTLPLLQIQTLTDDTGQKDRLKEDNCRKEIFHGCTPLMAKSSVSRLPPPSMQTSSETSLALSSVLPQKQQVTTTYNDDVIGGRRAPVGVPSVEPTPIPHTHTHLSGKKKIELDWFSHTDCKALTTLSALLCGQGQLPVVVKGAKGTHADFSLRKATKPQYDSTKATRLLLSLTRGDSMVTAPWDQVDSSTHYSRFDHDPESIRSHP